MLKHLNSTGDFEMVPIARLKQHERNVNSGDFGAIHESIEANGFFGALVVQRSTQKILAGNHRYAAAKQLGYTELPVTWVDVSDDAALRILLADNRTARLGHDEPNALAELLAELAGTDKGLIGTGYDGDALDQLLSELAGGPQSGLLADADPDDVPENVPTRVKPGDSWQLGVHRLLCGDSTKPGDVARVVQGDKISLVWTDPPYGVAYGDKNAFLNAVGRGNRIQERIENDHLSNEQTQEIAQKALALACEHSNPGAALYVASPAGTLLPHFIAAVAGSGFDFRWQLVWVKNMFVLGRSDYHFRHENLLYGWKPGAAHYFVDDHTQDSVFEYDKPHKSDTHPTTKPLGLVQKAVENSGRVGQIVYDCFTGSGTTLMACEATGRIFRGLELTPGYSDVILTRWENATGKTAELIEHGTP